MRKIYKERYGLIVKCKRPDKEMELPCRLKLIGVGEGAFCVKRRQIIEKVSIPGNIRTIQKKAFSDCSGLKTVVFPPAGQVIVEERAFENCFAMESLQNMNSVISIGESAFKNCYSLKEAAINPYLIEFGAECFSGCHQLKQVQIPILHRIIPEKAFYDCQRLTSLEMGPAVEIVREKAFAGCMALESLAFSSPLRVIEKKAFSGCYNLKNVQIGQDLKKIGKGAFSGCRALSEVVIGEENSNEKLRKIKIQARAFEGCFELKSLQLMPAKWKISANAFQNCRLDENHPLTIVVHNEKSAQTLRRALKKLIQKNRLLVICPEEQNRNEAEIKAEEGCTEVTPDMPLLTPVESAEATEANEVTGTTEIPEANEVTETETPTAWEAHTQENEEKEEKEEATEETTEETSPAATALTKEKTPELGSSELVENENASDASEDDAVDTVESETKE